MPTNRTTAAGGQFGTVGPAEPQRVTADEIDVDLQNLDETEREIVEADEFIIYGKANIEQWNDPGPGEDDLYIEMEAFEGNIDQLLALENISIGHNDVRIGEPLESHTLDTDATVHIDAGETLDLEEGAELRTGVIREGEQRPDGQPAQEDALWLVANLFGRDDPRGSRFSQKARLGAYYGELDGFSVTVDKTDMTLSEEGTRVHDVDFLAVTVGSDEMIKNPGSSFGVAEFQALFGDDSGLETGLGSRSGGGSAANDPHKTSTSRRSGRRDVRGEDAVRPGTLERQLSMSGILQRVLGSSRDALASEAIGQAYDEGIDLETAVEQTAGDENYEAVMQAVEEKDEQLNEGIETIAEEAEDADAIEDQAASLADELGVDKEVVMAAVEEIRDLEEEMNEDGGGPPSDDDDDDDDDGGDGGNGDNMETQQVIDENELADRVLEQLSDDADVAADDITSALDEIEFEGTETQLDVTVESGDGGLDEEKVEQMIDERVGAVEETVAEQLDGVGESLAESLSQQMETASTPAGQGGGIDNVDLESQIDEMAEDIGVEVED